MSKEAPIVYHAEAKRVKGPQREALEMARKHGRIDPKMVETLPPEELADKMRWWRIWTTTLMSLHKGEWCGEQAAKYLLEAKSVFQAYYNQETTIQTAREMKSDAEGHEYQMMAEMFRDKGRYCLCVASLIGNAGMVTQAVMYFNQATKEAEKDTSAWAVASMEEQIARRRLGRRINWKTFTLAYQTAVKLSPEAGGWDRMAAVSWCYTKEALLAGRKDNLRVGLTNLREASQKLGVNWVKRYPLKDLVSSALSVSRRIGARRIPLEKFRI
jgi:hypothetical protein